MSAKSLADLLRASCDAWPARTALLTHKAGRFQPITYAELWDQVRQAAARIRSLGLAKGDRLCIQSENCPEWAYIDWASQVLGVVLVPIYPTLPPDQAQHIVGDCGARVVISGEGQEAKMDGLEGVRVIPIAEFFAMEAPQISAAEMDASIDSIAPEDLATIIYTSGTTGVPKGAMLQHRGFTALMEAIPANLPINKDDVFLSFLPLSHVYERVAGHALPISCGGCIAYARSIATLAADMEAVRPTIMLCVPRFLESMRDRMMGAAAKQSWIRRTLFSWALAQGAARAKGRFAPLASALDKLVGSKIRARTGGRIRFFVSGGAALSPTVTYFYHAFGLTVLQGYGLTETTAASCVNHPDRNRPWTVGPPIPGVELKIAPDGEILIRGPSRMQGYYNMPEATAEAIDADGWFHTGDIGEMEDGYLKITDRKKDIIVLANGKNVAPQRIEALLKESALIAEAVVFGDGMEHCTALIVPDFEALRAALSSKISDADLAASEDARALVRREVEQVNRRLADFERVKRHSLLGAPLTIEAGELTPSMKVRRKVVKDKYAAELEAMRR